MRAYSSCYRRSVSATSLGHFATYLKKSEIWAMPAEEQGHVVRTVTLSPDLVAQAWCIQVCHIRFAMDSCMINVSRCISYPGAQAHQQGRSMKKGFSGPLCVVDQDPGGRGSIDLGSWLACCALPSDGRECLMCMSAEVRKRRVSSPFWSLESIPVTMPMPDCRFRGGFVGVQVVAEKNVRAIRNREGHDRGMLSRDWMTGSCEPADAMSDPSP